MKVRETSSNQTFDVSNTDSFKHEVSRVVPPPAVLPGDEGPRQERGHQLDVKERSGQVRGGQDSSGAHVAVAAVQHAAEHHQHSLRRRQADGERRSGDLFGLELCSYIAGEFLNGDLNIGPIEQTPDLNKVLMHSDLTIHVLNYLTQ